jgi:hypothetical protein
MAGAKKTFKKVIETHKKQLKSAHDPSLKNQAKTFDPTRLAKEAVGDVGDTFTPEIPEPEEETIIPIPNEQTAETQARKRRARKSTSGRSSTILTEGLGG